MEFLYLFFCVGLCPTRFLPVQDAWTHQSRRRSTQRRRSRGPQSTRSSSKHVLQKGHKWNVIKRLTWWHVEAPGTSDRHRDLLTASSNVDPSDDRDLHHNLLPDRTAGGGPSSRSWCIGSGDRDRASSWSFIGRWRRFMEEHHDRGPIEPRSRRDHGSFIVESIPWSSKGIQWWIAITISPRSWPDRGAIAARSWPVRGAIVASFEANLRKNSPWIRELQSRPKESLPRPLKIAPTTASIAHDFGLIFSLKNWCISPFVLQLLID